MSPIPSPVRRVIGLGGVGDIERATGLAQVCGPTIVPALIGKPSAARPDVYSDTSLSRLLPNGATIVMITGAEDDVTPPAYARTYVDEVQAAGGAAELVIVSDAAHFDVVTIGTPAWRVVSEQIDAALKR
jgi:acetyl esterase/lipase